MIKNQAGQKWRFLLRDAYGAPVTSGTTSMVVSLDGANEIAGSGALVQQGSGWVYTPTQAETNVDSLYIRASNDAAVTPQDTNIYPKVPAITQAQAQSAVAAALTTYDPPTKAELDGAVSPLATSAALTAAIATIVASVDDLENVSAADILASALTESYASNGASPTLTQAILAIHQHLMDFNINGTQRVVKKLDSVSTAFTEVLNDATAPTGLTR